MKGRGVLAGRMMSEPGASGNIAIKSKVDSGHNAAAATHRRHRRIL